MNKIMLFKLAITFLWKALKAKRYKEWYTHKALIKTSIPNVTHEILFNEERYAYASEPDRQYPWYDDKVYPYNCKKMNLIAKSIKQV